MPRLLLICLLCFLSIGAALAQTKRIDSLRAVLAKHPQADTFRVNRLFDLVTEGFMTLPETQRDSLVDVALQLARRLDYPFGQAMGLFFQAAGKANKNQKEQANELAEQALPLIERSGNKTYLFNILDFLSFTSQGKQRIAYLQRLLPMAQARPIPNKVEQLFRINIGIVDGYIGEGNYPVALQLGLSLLAKIEKDTNLIHHYLALSDIATIYTRLKDFDKALIYLKRSQLVASKRKDKTQQGATLSNIGKIYQQQGQQDKAIEAFKQALPFMSNDREDWVINIESQLASSYEQKGSYQQAFAYAHRALGATQTKKEKDVFNYFDGYKRTIFKTLSQVHLHTGQLDSAFYYAQQSLQNARKQGDKQFVRDANETLAQVYAAQQDYANAYRYQSEFMALKDSLNNEEVTRKTTAAQFTFEMDRQRSQIALLTKDKQIQAEQARRVRLLQEAKAVELSYNLDRNKSQIALLNKDKQLQAEAARRKELTRQAEAAHLQNQMSQQQAEARRQRLLFLSSLAVLVLLMGLAVLLYRNNRNKQKANVLLERQKTEIQHQRDQTQQVLTDLKTTQQQLVQKEKMASLGELTAGIAHEIQNPLNFVNNFSEVSTELVTELEEEQQNTVRDPELEAELLGDLKQNLQKITQHGQRASSIVKGMLEHSRSSTGEVEPTNLNALVDEYLRLSYHGLRAKEKEFNCDLVTHFDSNIGEVNVVAQEIGRVLLNLFNNAFYAVWERQKQGLPHYQPMVTISTQKTKESIQVRVVDNGTGMSESVKQKIFQPFFTTKPTGEGTGLGLSLSYDIVIKGHGGSLLVESQEGKGTEFIIQLPVDKTGVAV